MVMNICNLLCRQIESSTLSRRLDVITFTQSTITTDHVKNLLTAGARNYRAFLMNSDEAPLWLEFRFCADLRGEEPSLSTCFHHLLKAHRGSWVDQRTRAICLVAALPSDRAGEYSEHLGVCRKGRKCSSGHRRPTIHLCINTLGDNDLNPMRYWVAPWTGSCSLGFGHFYRPILYHYAMPG